MTYSEREHEITFGNKIDGEINSSSCIVCFRKLVCYVFIMTCFNWGSATSRFYELKTGVTLRKRGWCSIAVFI